MKTLAFQSQPKYDGWILESGESTNQGGELNNDARSIFAGDDSTNKQYKGILSFDTTPLPNNAVILSVQLKVRQREIVGSNPFDTFGVLQSEIRKGTFSDNANLQIDDFSAPASPGSVLDTFAQLTPNWYATEVHDANFALVNKSGITQFRLSFSKDDNNNLQADTFSFYSGNYLSSYMPQLVVTYYIP